MISPTQNAQAMLDELKMGNLQGEEREKTLAALEKRFDDVILSVVLAALSPEEFEKFKAALKSENPEESIAAITGSIPGLAQMIEERIHQEYQLLKTVMV